MPLENSPIIEYLDWDSNNFGIKVGNANTPVENLSQAQNLQKLAQSMGFQLIYYRFTAPHAIAEQIARQMKWFLADQKTTYIKTSQPPTSQVSDKIISYAQHPLTPKLLSLAMQAAEYSRFKVDPKFTHKEYEILYKVWIERSLKQEIAQDVLVYLTDNGVEAGLVTLGEKNGRGDIGIIAVDGQFRGHGIGQQLVQAANNFFVAKGYQNLQVVTQKSNSTACHFYERCGYQVGTVENIYHIWL